ncbi:hypothetical protein [Streptomyces sp. NBC_01190]|uniref:hypothetical protein n=1 Tax=Streptomyces sp. NBC_01190 TaxID=2903767 RepID=UPI003869B6F5|nr:hypothetical protein OG519_03395 [Streptomyces sp. NBC_01190]
MTTYIVTVPGTFLDAPPEGTQEALVRALRPINPHTDSGEEEDLDILTVYSGTPAFSLRMEVEADTKTVASDAARDLAASALLTAGVPPESTSLGEPVITGIEVE